jgi:hypothetical protein
VQPHAAELRVILERGRRRFDLAGPEDVREVIERIPEAAGELFQADVRVRAVGLTPLRTGFGFGVVRNAAIPVAMAGVSKIEELSGIPVVYDDALGEPTPHAVMAYGAVLGATNQPEANQGRPIVIGAELENLDADLRRGLLPTYRTLGSLACMVQTDAGGRGVLTAAHVLAPMDNDGQAGDTVVQNGGGPPASGLQIGQLDAFAALEPSDPNASPGYGVVFNAADAAIAALDDQQSAPPRFHPSRGLGAPTGTRSAQLGEPVFKVGRTTGLQTGLVSITTAQFGPMAYPGVGYCWFDDVFVITGAGFADYGDSGSAIFGTDGAVLGILMGGGAGTYYASPIGKVCLALGCRVLV